MSLIFSLQEGAEFREKRLPIQRQLGVVRRLQVDHQSVIVMQRQEKVAEGPAVIAG